MSHNRPRTKKVMITSTSPDYPVYCPKCNSDRVVIFFDPKFVGRFMNKWDELIDERKITLENSWNKIKTENQWGIIDPKDAKPNWLCKECYDGGILLEVQNDNQ